MEMKAEDFLTDDFLKHFKTGQQLNDFIHSIQQRAIEKMLEGELDDHLGYEKHKTSDSSNARNGYNKKKVKSNLGEMEIQVPRDREGSFNPMLVPKRENMLEGLEEVMIHTFGDTVDQECTNCSSQFALASFRIDFFHLVRVIPFVIKSNKIHFLLF